MYYLWLDKKSTKNKPVVYITDYKEIAKDGKVKIDDFGYIDVDLLYSSPIKNDCIRFAQKMFE